MRWYVLTLSCQLIYHFLSSSSECLLYDFVLICYLWYFVQVLLPLLQPFWRWNVVNLCQVKLLNYSWPKKTRFWRIEYCPMFCRRQVTCKILFLFMNVFFLWTIFFTFGQPNNLLHLLQRFAFLIGFFVPSVRTFLNHSTHICAFFVIQFFIIDKWLERIFSIVKWIMAFLIGIHLRLCRFVKVTVKHSIAMKTIVWVLGLLDFQYLFDCFFFVTWPHQGIANFGSGKWSDRSSFVQQRIMPSIESINWRTAFFLFWL